MAKDEPTPPAAGESEPTRENLGPRKATFTQKVTAIGACLAAIAAIVTAVVALLGISGSGDRVPQVDDILAPSEVGVGPVVDILGTNLDLVSGVLFIGGGKRFRVPHLPGEQAPRSHIQIVVPDTVSAGEYSLMFNTIGGTIPSGRTIVVKSTTTPTSPPTREAGP